MGTCSVNCTCENVQNYCQTNYIVYCVFEKDWENCLDDELKAIGKRYDFQGKENTYFDYQSADVTKLVIGCGTVNDLSDYLKIGKKIYDLTEKWPKDIKIGLPLCGSPFSVDAIVNIHIGLQLQTYNFLKYKTTEHDKSNNIKNHEICFVLNDDIRSDVEKRIADYQGVIEGNFIARDLGHEPPNVLYPESYAERVKSLFKDHPEVSVKILHLKDLETMHMGGIIAVGKGSSRPPCIVALEYNGGNKGDKPLAFVGKGVTFDSGGLSLKPTSAMVDMKNDMCGSAAVVGLMKALVARKAKANVVGVIGLAENMTGSNAYRPDDIVTTASGKTIEICNTDAEGRVVLADTLWYAQKYNPKCIIDLATLTGAIVVSLGHIYAGIFTESDQLASKLEEAGKIVNEPVWRLPLHKKFEDSIKSDIADVRNTSKVKGGGSTTAAHFLREFVSKDYPWCHIDIAGVAYDYLNDIFSGKSASGYGVRLLDHFVRLYEREEFI